MNKLNLYLKGLNTNRNFYLRRTTTSESKVCISKPTHIIEFPESSIKSNNSGKVFIKR